MLRRSVLANLIECRSNAMLDFPSLVFGADSLSQRHHVIQRLRDAAVRKRIDSNAEFLHAISQHRLRAVDDHEVRPVFDDLFDIRIEQSTNPWLVRSRSEFIVVADGDYAISQSK